MYKINNTKKASTSTESVTCATTKQLPKKDLEVFTAVTMKNCVFWDVTPCGSCKNIQEDTIIIVTAVKTSNLT
jgi:hypothetical protein